MMSDNRTKEQLEEEIRVRDLLEKEREISDKCYARKIAETILFGLVAMFCLAVVGALIKLVLKQ